MPWPSPCSLWLRPKCRGWRVYTKIPPFSVAKTHELRYPKWWVEAKTNGFGSCMWFTYIYMCFQSVSQHEASTFLPLWPSIVARRAWPASTFGEKWRSWTGSRRQPPTSAALNGEITVPIFFSKKDFKLKERTFYLIGHATWSSAHLHLHIYIYWNYMKLQRYLTVDVEKLHIVMQFPYFTHHAKAYLHLWAGLVEGGLKGKNAVGWRWIEKTPPKKGTNHVLSSCWGDFWGEHFVRNFGGPVILHQDGSRVKMCSLISWSLSQTTPMVWKIHNENERPEWMTLTIKGTRYL